MDGKADRTQAEMWGGMKGPRRESTRWVGKGTEIFCLEGLTGGVGWGWAGIHWK